MHANVILQRTSLAGVLIAATLPSLAGAADAELAQCLDAADGGEQKRCTQELFRKASDELKTAYAGALQKAADSSSSAALAESQRAWEIYRDAECKGVVGRGGGSGRMVWTFGCLAEKTRARVEELKVPFYQR
ncbi:MAG: lysozyme inhibitor LprI family protein [Xanthobacteraceae bacterium]|nr:lysozyme inhibitor LprI family protein [Xanthobacteraceae bacterium]